LEIRVARIAGANDGDGLQGRRNAVDSFFNGLLTILYISAFGLGLTGA